ncbi:GNAT family N-acetyltransferase [Micromonospora pisi]|uniref:GNAT family N-acetyltransferase n=1 Tax=Micromonospora pisi TaxID=589240 RepID=UPI001FE4DFF8|nr:GNAT family N-acetyltransferase [Micromonospora pisi]
MDTERTVDIPPTWRTLTGDDLPAVAALATRCLAVDGGLPLVTDASFLARRFAADGGVARGAVDPAGTLIAAGAVRPRETQGVRAAVATGLVDPAHRGRGLGAALLDWALDPALTGAEQVTVETEALTDGARTLFAARGLGQTFAEDVLRFDLAGTEPPPIDLPAGLTVRTWSTGLAGRFFAVYQAAFRERPGFPDWSARQWVEWTTDDEDFRPEWTLLATDPTGADLGFVTAGQGWIVQVGVRPEARGRRLGAALVVAALRRMRSAGSTEALLDVNVDNPAGTLYRRLGFIDLGRRARFATQR